MSGIITSGAIAATALTTVMATAFPEVSHALAPFIDGGSEYAAFTLGILVSVPGLALLTLLATATPD